MFLAPEHHRAVRFQDRRGRARDGAPLRQRPGRPTPFDVDVQPPDLDGPIKAVMWATLAREQGSDGDVTACPEIRADLLDESGDVRVDSFEIEECDR